MQEQRLNRNERQIILSLSGGLGNQLWQLAYAYSLMKHNSCSSILLDDSYYRNHPGYIRKPELDAFLLADQIFRLDEAENLPLEYRLYCSLFSKYRGLNFLLSKKYIDNPFDFMYKKGYVITHNRVLHAIPHNKKTLWLNGYFENYEQIKEILPKFRELLVLRTKSSEYEHFSKLILQSERPVALSVRCGEDYIKAGRMVCTADYYNKALSKFENREVFLFSDEPDNALGITGLNNNVIVIPVLTPPEQLLLMSMCSDFILSNSTFSYWGALLGKNENKKTVYPSQWLPWLKTENAVILYGTDNIVIEV